MFGIAGSRNFNLYNRNQPQGPVVVPCQTRNPSEATKPTATESQMCSSTESNLCSSTQKGTFPSSKDLHCSELLKRTTEKLEKNSAQKKATMVLRTREGVHTLESFEPLRDDSENDNGLWELVSNTKPVRKKAVLYVGNLTNNCTSEKLQDYVLKRATSNGRKAP